LLAAAEAPVALTSLLISPQDKWAKTYLLYEFYIFLTWLLSFQLFVWLFQVRGRGPLPVSNLIRRLAAQIELQYQKCTDLKTDFVNLGNDSNVDFYLDNMIVYYVFDIYLLFPLQSKSLAKQEADESEGVRVFRTRS